MESILIVTLACGRSGIMFGTIPHVLDFTQEAITICQINVLVSFLSTWHMYDLSGKAFYFVTGDDAVSCYQNGCQRLRIHRTLKKLFSISYSNQLRAYFNTFPSPRL